MNLRKLQLPAFILVAGVSAFGNAQAWKLAHGLEEEGKERRNQSCTISERAQAKKVKALKDTYDYLVETSPSERRTTLYMFVRQSLPEKEAEAHFDEAPLFCDKPGIGEPEPDPKIPARPAELR